MSEVKTPRYYTINQFARVFQMQPDTIERFLHLGVLRGVRISNGNKGSEQRVTIRIEDPGKYLAIPDRTEDIWPLMREHEVATILGVSPRMVRKLTESGKIRPRRVKKMANVERGKRAYSISDIRTLIAYRTDPEAKGAARSALVTKWAIEQIIGRPLEVDLYETVTSGGTTSASPAQEERCSEPTGTPEESSRFE